MTNPDAALIADCEELMRANDAIDTKAAASAYERLRDAIAATRPVTLGGLRAKARAAQHVNRDRRDDLDGDDSLALSVIRDVIGERAVAS